MDDTPNSEVPGINVWASRSQLNRTNRITRWICLTLIRLTLQRKIINVVEDLHETIPDFWFLCGDMSKPYWKKIQTFALLLSIITFTTFLFSYTLRDPSMYFFKYASRLSGSLFAKGPCACHQCMTELEDDPWFAERFNQSIHPLMTRENSVLSDDTFKWWQVRVTGCAPRICVASLCWVVKKEKKKHSSTSNL